MRAMVHLISDEATRAVCARSLANVPAASLCTRCFVSDGGSTRSIEGGVYPTKQSSPNSSCSKEFLTILSIDTACLPKWYRITL
jgi:hypothetical protein